MTRKKEELRASSDLHKKAIDRDLKQLAHKTEKAVGDALLTVGALLSILMIYKLIKGTGGKKSSRVFSRLQTVLKHQIGLYILNEGRSKIVDYINSLDETKQ